VVADKQESGETRLKNLYLLHTPGVDHTSVALGLALQFRDEGYRVGYFKPVGDGPTDQEAVLMQRVLDPEMVMPPFTAGPSYLSCHQRPSLLPDLLNQAYRQAATHADLVLLGCPAAPWAAAAYRADPASLALAFNAAVLLVARVKNDFSADEAIVYNEYLAMRNVPVAGTLFNNVPRALLAKTRGVYVPLLEERNIPVVGVIPAQATITAPTVAEIHEALGGEILAGENNLHLRVEDVVVGAMTIESALTYLRRSPNKALVTGGDRADMALAALETSTAAIILTGGLYPDVKVIARARDAGVPLILVHQDTYAAVERLNNVTHHIRPADHEAIAAARNNIGTYCRWPDILAALRES